MRSTTVALVLVLFLTFFLEFVEDELHVSRASVGSEATLALWEVHFGDGWYESVEQDSGKYLASNG